MFTSCRTFTRQGTAEERNPSFLTYSTLNVIIIITTISILSLLLVSVFLLQRNIVVSVIKPLCKRVVV
jgi:hypothetical protein